MARPEWRWLNTAMRKYINIVESPLADIEVHGEPLDREGSFSAKDRAYMRRAIIKGIYKKALKGVPFNLYIYVLNKSPLDDFGNGVKNDKYPETELNQEFLDRIMIKYPELEDCLYGVMDAIGVNRIKDPTAIHFVMGDNFSDNNQIVPTPWIMIHRLMHTWIETNPMVSFNFVPEIKKHLTFKSALNHIDIEMGELIAEIATQFLITGKIGLKNLDDIPPDHRYAITEWATDTEQDIANSMKLFSGKSFYI